MWALGILACASPSLAPSRDLADDAMLATLPADATLVAGADLADAERLPAWLDVPGREALERGGAERVRVGCFDEGCVALAEGDLDAVRAMAEGLPGAVRRARGVDLHTDLGPVVLRKLAPRKAVAGDRAAVARVATERALGEPGFDAAVLDGLVPAGEAFVAALGRDALDMLADRVGVALPDVPGVRAVAAALDLDAGLVRVRARCDDPEAVATMARLQLARAGLDGDVATVGDLVEVTVAAEDLR